MNDPRDVLEMHLITEKSTQMQEVANCYVFRVARKATKPSIKEAIEKAFKVKVKSVRTMTIPGKPKRMGRFDGTTPAWKKAVVTLREGEAISEFENI